MRTHISLRILNSVEGRFVTVMTNTGAKVNGKIITGLTRGSTEFLYMRRAKDGRLCMIRRTDVKQINGELCNIKIEAAV